MVLFVATAQGKKVDRDLEERIRVKIRADISPRYVPDMIVQVPKIPKTLNGKKMEVPVKKVLLGGDPSKVLNLGAVSDPDSLVFFVQLARSRVVGGRRQTARDSEGN